LVGVPNRCEANLKARVEMPVCGQFRIRSFFVVLGALAVFFGGPLFAAESEDGATLVMRDVLAGHHAFEVGDPPTSPVAPFNPFGDTPLAESSDACGVPSNVWEQFPQFLPPIASGSFVNFESPPVKPLALSADGSRLYAVNTPNNSVVVYDTVGGLTRLREIPVGLDPVSLAVQPVTGLVWVANHVSDNVAVIDPVTGSTVAIVEVGDEPVSIVFEPTGLWAFVVIQGIALDEAFSDPSNPRQGHLVVIDGTTHQRVSSTYLDANTPRAVVYDDVNDRVIVAALFSGNNTTVVGEPVTLEIDPAAVNPFCPQTCVRPMLELLRDFSVTAQAFAANLGDYPDKHDDSSLDPSAPLVNRIVEDAGSDGPWHSVIALLVDANGDPDPTVIATMNAEFGITNAADIIDKVLNDTIDTTDHDLIVLNASNPGSASGLGIVKFVSQVGTTLTGMARHPDGRLFVSNMEALNEVRLEQQLRGQIVNHEIVIVADPSSGPSQGPVLAVDLLQLGAGGVTGGPTPAGLTEQDASLANPVDIVLHTNGLVAFVAALGPGRVGAINTSEAAVLGRVDVGRGTRGLVLNSSTNTLYVLNRTDLSISVVDVTDPAAMTVIQSVDQFNPEPLDVRVGRDFLYSTRFSDNFNSSCAVCHIDGHLDHLPWDLGDKVGGLQPPPPPLQNVSNHPMKGPMVTLSLRGLKGHDPLHWRGDKVQFQEFNPAFDGLLGGSQLPPEDMDAYTDFIHTVVYPPNPFYNRDNTFRDETRALCAIVPYITSCQPCHRLEHGGAMPGTAVDPPEDGDLGGNFSGPPLFAQLEVVTQLRGIDKKFQSDRFNGVGLIHDGRESRKANDHPLDTFLNQFFPALDQHDMISLLNAFPTENMPVIGWQLFATGDMSPASIALVDGDLLVMIAQNEKVPTHCDIVAKALLGGETTGYVYVGSDQFESDMGQVLTRADLFASLAAGDSIVFTAVPPGSGKRIGVDQDLDCLADGFDAQPQVNNQADGNFDGWVTLSDFYQMFDCFALDGPLPPDCHVYDSDCDEFLGTTDADAFMSLYDDPIFDCDGNGTADLLDILFGTYVDADRNGVPDVCAAGIPTVSQWGVLAMVLLLASAGTVVFSRRGRRWRAVADH
jgi:YVTN family beta-propeller protein